MTAAGGIMLLAALTFAAALVGFGWTIGAIVADSFWAWLTEPDPEPEPDAEPER